MICCYGDKFSKLIQLCRGEKAVYKLLEAMLQEVEYCKKVKKDHFNQPMNLTSMEEEEFAAATECHICQKYFIEDDIRVRDHCNIIGKYRGAAHNKCNRSFRLTVQIPVIFHKLKVYDLHLIMQEIGKFKMNISVIPTI